VNYSRRLYGLGWGGYIEEPGPGTIYPYLGFSSCLLAGFCIGDDGPRPAVIESSSRVFIGETRRKKIRNESSSLLSARLVCKYYTKFMQGPLAGANPHPTSRRWASVQRCAIERKAEALDGDAEWKTAVNINASAITNDTEDDKLLKKRLGARERENGESIEKRLLLHDFLNYIYWRQKVKERDGHYPGH
jgi:hypothetical protein